MKIIHPYHVGFVVSDMQRSIDFYTNVLGMRVEREPVEVASSWLADVVGYEEVSIVLGMAGVGSGTSIELLQYKKPNGGRREHLEDRNRVGSAHCGMLVDNVLEWYEHLKANGVRVTGPPTLRDVGYPWGRYALYFQDPDGNWLEFAERAPRPEGSTEF